MLVNKYTFYYSDKKLSKEVWKAEVLVAFTQLKENYPLYCLDFFKGPIKPAQDWVIYSVSWLSDILGDLKFYITPRTTLPYLPGRWVKHLVLWVGTQLKPRNNLSNCSSLQCVRNIAEAHTAPLKMEDGQDQLPRSDYRYSSIRSKQ